MQLIANLYARSIKWLPRIFKKFCKLLTKTATKTFSELMKMGWAAHNSASFRQIFSKFTFENWNFEKWNAHKCINSSTLTAAWMEVIIYATLEWKSKLACTKCCRRTCFFYFLHVSNNFNFFYMCHICHEWNAASSHERRELCLKIKWKKKSCLQRGSNFRLLELACNLHQETAVDRFGITKNWYALMTLEVLHQIC